MKAASSAEHRSTTRHTACATDVRSVKQSLERLAKSPFTAVEAAFHEQLPVGSHCCPSSIAPRPDCSVLSIAWCNIGVVHSTSLKPLMMLWAGQHTAHRCVTVVLQLYGVLLTAAIIRTTAGSGSLVQYSPVSLHGCCRDTANTTADGVIRSFAVNSFTDCAANCTITHTPSPPNCSGLSDNCTQCAGFQFESSPIAAQQPLCTLFAASGVASTNSTNTDTACMCFRRAAVPTETPADTAFLYAQAIRAPITEVGGVIGPVVSTTNASTAAAGMWHDFVLAPTTGNGWLPHCARPTPRIPPLVPRDPTHLRRVHLRPSCNSRHRHVCVFPSLSVSFGFFPRSSALTVTCPLVALQGSCTQCQGTWTRS
jgi:hypothetical protein